MIPKILLTIMFLLFILPFVIGDDTYGLILMPDAMWLNSTNFNATNIYTTNLNVYDWFNMTGLVISGGWVNTTNLNVSERSWFGSNATFDTDTLFVDATHNRVGIGTTRPTETLTVIGTLNTTGNTSIGTDVLFVDNTSSRVGIGTASPKATLNVVGDVYHNLSTVSQNFNIVNATGNSRFFVDNSNGRVGIGTTSPGYKLVVNGNVKFYPAGNKGAEQAPNIAFTNDDTNEWIQIGLNSDNSYSDRGFNFRTIKTTGGNGFVDALTIKYDGNVGIGTTTPTETLSVVGSANISQWLNGTDINASNQICLGGVCNTAWPAGTNNITGYGTAGYVPLWENTTALNNSVIYQLGSNIGIGTTTPLAKLDVIGNITVNSTTQSGITMTDETGAKVCMMCWSDRSCNNTAGECG